MILYSKKFGISLFLFFLDIPYKVSPGKQGGCVPLNSPLELCDTSTCNDCREEWELDADGSWCFSDGW